VPNIGIEPHHLLFQWLPFWIGICQHRSIRLRAHAILI